MHARSEAKLQRYLSRGIDPRKRKQQQVWGAVQMTLGHVLPSKAAICQVGIASKPSRSCLSPTQSISSQPALKAVHNLLLDGNLAYVMSQVRRLE